MAIGHKKTELVSGSLAFAIRRLSKNALVDLVWDLAVKHLGEDRATDEAIADQITEWLDPVAAYRNDKRLNLREIMERSRAKAARHRQLTSQNGT